MTVVDGLGLRATVDPEGWPERRILACLDRELSLIENDNSVGVAIDVDHTHASAVEDADSRSPC